MANEHGKKGEVVLIVAAESGVGDCLRELVKVPRYSHESPQCCIAVLSVLAD